jgi:DNA-binding transcriptional LysR family regulator
VKFSRWEADLAIRLRKPDKGDFTISKLAEVRLYFIEPAASPDVEPIVCGYPSSLDLIPESRFLEARGLRQHSRCITDNVRLIRTLIQTRRAVGVLPEYLCEELLADRRLRMTLLPQRRDVWLLVQSHLKRDRAARIVIDWVRRCFQDFSRT